MEREKKFSIKKIHFTQQQTEKVFGSKFCSGCEMRAHRQEGAIVAFDVSAAGYVVRVL